MTRRSPFGLRLENAWTRGHYSIYRFLFGGYLCLHFAFLIPWGPELFSRTGMLPDAAASPLAFVLPNVLAVFDQPASVVALLVLACMLSLAFAFGCRDRWAALGLWYVWACLHARNPLIGNPGLPYVGWLLLAHAVMPRARWPSRDVKRSQANASRWRMPPELFAVAWILMVVGYSYSGLTKLASPSWIDGSALLHVLENPLARPTALRASLLQVPEVLSPLTWAALGLELLAAPLALSRRLRPWLWCALLAMHLSLLVLVDFADLSLGMVVLHFFTFDPGWLPRRLPARPEVLCFDADSSLCRAFAHFVLSEDRGRAFHLAQLSEPAEVPVNRSARLIVLAEDSRTLFGWSALAHVLYRLGGVWHLAARLAHLVPLRVGQLLYDGVARNRWLNPQVSPLPP